MRTDEPEQTPAQPGPTADRALVTHAKFGRGHVIELRACGARRRFLVHFDDGVKRLILEAYLRWK